MVESPLLDPRQACEWLRLTDDRPESAALSALRRLVQIGDVKALKIGRRRMFQVSDLQGYLDGQSTPLSPRLPS